MNKYIAAVILCGAGVLEVNAMTQQQSQPKAGTAQLLRSDLNIKFVDSFQVMSGCKDGQAAAKKLEDTRTKLTNEIQDLEKARVQAVNDLKVKGSMLSDTARVEAEKRARKLDTDCQAKLRDSEDEMKIAMQIETEKLAKEIEEVVTAVAVKDKLDAVIDMMTGRVIYASEKMVLTKELVGEMDKKREIRIAQAKNTKKDNSQVSA